ncbi:MAG: pyruvate kinase [Eubacterium sp.]|nr:pyruvate kinase [Eubacterium sp.]
MSDVRKTKIVCTLGPATDRDDVLKQLMLEGMNVARFNFSHGTHEEQKARLEKVVALREELNLPIATLLDTKGPEIRIRTLEGGKAELVEGQTLILTTEDIVGNAERVSITYKNLYKDVIVGSKILIDDGLIEMEVIAIKDTDIVCVVHNGGSISNRKGINVPNVDLSMPYISETDYKDIVFGVKNGFDFIAASFVRTAQDVLAIRKILEEQGCPTIGIIAKIENKQGVKNIDEIIKVSDGIMVARGDMGVEIPFEEVPAIQKMIIQKVYQAGKWVITATQMLDSMMKNPRPTRAEAADVANAVYDGTSAVMLSGETAAGLYPVEALQAMVRIAISTEADINYANRMKKRGLMVNPDITSAIAHATCTTAIELNAAAIITVSHSGRTARMVSKYRPGVPIIGCSVNPHVCRQLNLSWGVTPVLVEMQETSDELFEHAVARAESVGMVQSGELVVLTAGVPLGVSGTTNLIKVQVAGHVIATGRGLLPLKTSGNLCVVETPEQLRERFNPGDIIVTKDTNNDMMPEIRKAAGLIVEASGKNSHAAIVGLSLDLPVIMGAQNATQILKTGAFVTLDGERGTVSCNTCERD